MLSNGQESTVEIPPRRQQAIIHATVVGLVAGLFAVSFEVLIRLVQDIGIQMVAQIGSIAWIVFPIISAVLCGTAAWITQRYAPEAAGSGIPHTKLVLLNLREMNPARLIPVKIGAGLMAIIGGMSLGREGPTVQIGAAAGKIVATWLKAPTKLISTLIAAGAGAGLAAAFNAPLAGFIFVMEELKKEMTPLTYGTALVASVSAVAVKRVILGQHPTFLLKESDYISLPALSVVVVVGIAGAFVGIAFNRGLLAALDFRDRLKIPRPVYAAIIGSIAGLCLVGIPFATGGGHRAAEALLQGKVENQNLLSFLALALTAKFLLTIFSFSSGNPGGIFAPILVIGAVVGYAIGLIGQSALPTLHIVPALFATIGMAAVLTATVRAPLTGVVLIVEMTAEYRLLYALLIASFVAYVIAEKFNCKPIYDSLVERELRTISPSAIQPCE